MKRFLALLVSGLLLAGVLAGCNNNNAGTGDASNGGGTPAAGGERTVLEFWYHSGNETSNAIFEDLMEQFNASQDQYTAVYTGIAFTDIIETFTRAVVTDTMPDVISLGFSNMMTFVEMDALVDMNNLFEAWDGKGEISPALIEGTRNIGGGALYGIPYAYNQEVSWINITAMAENDIQNPITQSEFLATAEQFADPANDSYFFSLRAVRPYDNLVGWLFTYTDGAGYEGSYFDENGVCILDEPVFAEAMDAYADLYWKNWVSGDSVNNNYDEIVAEFGAGTSMMIMHNSSSYSNHLQNLGEGNFAAVKPLENGSGRYFTSALQPNIYSICNTKGADGDYAGAMELISFLAGSGPVSRMSEELGRVPANTESFNDAWAADSELLQLCLDIVNDPNFVQIQNPYWLTSFTDFIQNTMTTDFQAVLLGERTSADVLADWAEFLTNEQATYLANQ